MEQESGKGVTRQLHNVTGLDKRVMVSDTGIRSDPYSKTEGGGGGLFLKIYNGTRRDDGVGLRTSRSLIFHQDKILRKRAEANTATLLFTCDQKSIQKSQYKLKNTSRSYKISVNRLIREYR